MADYDLHQSRNFIKLNMANSLSDKNKAIAKNTIYMYIRMLIVILVSLYTTRIVLSTLGIDDYGIYNVVGGIVVLFSFINNGLSGAAKRFIMAELAVGNLDSQKKIFSTAVNAHLLIDAIIIVLGETVGLWILYHYMNIPAERMDAAAIVYQMSLFASVLSILQSPFNAVVISHERMSVYAFISVVDVFLKLGIVFIVKASNFDKLVLYAALFATINILNIVFYYFYCHRAFSMCRYVKTTDRNAFKALMEYVGWTVFGTGANVLSRQGVSILVNNFFSVAVNSAIGISNTIVNTATQFVHNFQIAFGPQITKNYISGNYSDLNKLVIRSSRYSSMLVLLILIPVTFVISDLLYIWLGNYPDYTEEFCVLTLICVFFEAISNPLTGVITSDKKIGKYQTVISTVYLAILLLSWIVLLFGAQPFFVVFVRMAADFAFIAVRLSMTKKKVDGFSISLWIKKVFVNSFLILVFCTPLIALNRIIIIDHIVARFFVQASVCLAWTGCLIWLIGLTKKEKEFVLSKIRRRI